MVKRLTITVLVLMTFVISLGNYLYINPVGPTLVPIARLIHDSPDGKTIAEGFSIEFWKTVDQALALVISGKAEFSLLPVTIGAKLAAEGVPIKLAAVSMWGGFYFVSRDEAIESIEDLLGKVVYTLHAPGQTADVILRGVLEKMGYEVNKDVKIVYVAGPEALQLFAAGKADILLLPEPFASLAQAKVQGSIKSMSIDELWEILSPGNGPIPSSGIFVREDVNPAVVDLFLFLYKQSLTLSLQDLDLTASIVSEAMGGFPVSILKRAFSGIDYEFKIASEIEDGITSYLKTLKELDESLVGDLNFDEFFYEK